MKRLLAILAALVAATCGACTASDNSIDLHLPLLCVDTKGNADGGWQLLKMETRGDTIVATFHCTAGDHGVLPR
jgi:hypothetical protein